MTSSKNSGLIAVILGVSVLFGCESSPTDVTWNGAVVLVSIDGFRWDYRDFAETPGLDYLASHGVSATLRPSFPSKTFVTHYTMVTGLYPNEHGVLGNTMYDPELNSRLSMGNEEAVADGRWWGGEPIWVTTEKAGWIAATCFWPGSEAEIDGVRPTHWKKYDGNVSDEQRMGQIVEWLALPEANRPSFLSVYFSVVDDAGHRSGPESSATARAIRHIDEQVVRLTSGIDSLGLTDKVNIVITSDHGMTQLSPDSVVFLDDYIDMDRSGWLSLGQYVSLQPDEADADDIYERLVDAHPALTVYRKGGIPERFHLDGHRRTPLIVGIVRNGWTATTHSWFEQRSDPLRGGGHGFDNMARDMAGIVIATGPAFRSGVSYETVDAVDIYNLLAASIGVTPAGNSGDPSVMVNFLEPIAD